MAAALVLSLVTAGSARADDLVQERKYLRVKIGGSDVRLEALFVKRADAKGRLPIAFFNHGRPAFREMTLDQKSRCRRSRHQPAGRHRAPRLARGRDPSPRVRAIRRSGAIGLAMCRGCLHVVDERRRR